jgi:hypothetical protein
MKDIYALMAEGKTEEEIKALFEAEMKCAQARKEEEEKAKVKNEKSLREAREHLVNAFLSYNEYYRWQEEEITDEDINELLELIVSFEETIMPYIELMLEVKKRKNEKNTTTSKDEEIISDFLKGLFG